MHERGRNLCSAMVALDHGVWGATMSQEDMIAQERILAAFVRDVAGSQNGRLTMVLPFSKDNRTCQHHG